MDTKRYMISDAARLVDVEAHVLRYWEDELELPISRNEMGHTFNMAINLLGAYVHTCRLQYVEFFGKFYEGGGQPFQPFKLKTKYVDIKEEK